MPATYLTSYNPEWPEQFRLLTDRLAEYLPAGCYAEHVGSTSIPGMAAKPIIDIDVVVPEGEMAAAIAGIIRAGYVHQGDLGIAGREAFDLPGPIAALLPAHHLYACEASAKELRRHLAFREYLRSHPEETARLSAHKCELAFERGLTRAEYIAAKGPLVGEITARALDWWAEAEGEERSAA